LEKTEKLTINLGRIFHSGRRGARNLVDEIGNHLCHAAKRLYWIPVLGLGKKNN
jgi:hypothetical protein